MSVDLGEMIDELRRLNEPVPRPRRLPTQSEVLRAEELQGVAFHEDFRRYLLEASDVVYGYVEPVTINGGHTALDAVFRNARESGVPDGLIPVCEDNGDYYCIAPTGEVVFWSHNGTTEGKLAKPGFMEPAGLDRRQLICVSLLVIATVNQCWSRLLDQTWPLYRAGWLGSREGHEILGPDVRRWK